MLKFLGIESKAEKERKQARARINPDALSTLSGHTDVVTALAALPNGMLASGSWDNSIKLWDVGCGPVLALREETADLRATTQPMTIDAGKAAREGGLDKKQAGVIGQVLPNPPPLNNPSAAATLPPAPPNNGKISGDSAASERDSLPALGGLSLSQGINTIAFSELALGEELGRGGFGVVSAAVWQGATQVAVKQLLGRLTPELLDEFKRETTVHARLRHPNILMLYGVCMESMRIAMVMEFMAQGSLYDVLRKPNELPWSLRLTLALDMASGLLYLHGQHIIHRDLKSLNILVDGQMHAKVSDFGLSKIKLTTASMTKGAGGTPHWMAPELFDEAANSEASDVYATGIVFWEIAARTLPYDGKNQMQIGRFVEKGNRETIPAGTPSSFASLMTRCWAQRAEDRPTMHDVARDLRTMAGGPADAGKSGSSPAPMVSGYAAFSR